ncbi:hypothetical protein [Bradyrhizobium sp.]|jgi:hypothetical protein|uniref:hypothetical protein n=1 Tax=Bradyrhizobium sp. TaxID=376 RepID=UPI002E00B629|nr:hypothetical protein [Bradyrhizobium sp.]
MIRTVWLAIACLIGIAALTVIKVGTTSFEAGLASDQTTATSAISETSLSDPSASATLGKADRLDVADEDAAKPVRPIAITTKVAAAAASEASSSEKSWRSSYAKRQAGVAKHRKGKLKKTSRRHGSYRVSRNHGSSKYMVVRKQKQKKSRSRR